MTELVQPIFMVSLPILLLVRAKHWLSGSLVATLGVVMIFMILGVASLKYNLVPQYGMLVGVPTVICIILGGFMLLNDV